MTKIKAYREDDITLNDGTVLAPIVKKILNNRGLSDSKAIISFLDPKLKDLPSPSLMKDMAKATKILTKAIYSQKKILIWGDYDVDGTTATALLMLFFRSLAMEAEYYIPNRLKEGYGIQEKGILAASKGKNPEEYVLITVDNGISAHDAIQCAKNIGYEVIVSDHHIAPQKSVPADAILNPIQPGCDFPDKTMAGVGVAFYLIMATRASLMASGYFDDNCACPNLKKLLDLVAVGTVADMVPLGGINRILVRAGMESISKDGNPGLVALCRACNLDIRCLRSEDISFQLAPKINAAGRLGEADKAIRLFMAKSTKDAKAIARDLVKNNERRKLISLGDLSKAMGEIDMLKLETQSSVVVTGDYHIGVAGIVASGLVESQRKPSVVLCNMGDGILKGSARSCCGIDLHLALLESAAALVGFGGHKMAGGMTLTEDNLLLFKDLFEQSVKKQTLATDTTEVVLVDGDMSIEELFTANHLRQLHLMEPFGQGNPQPIFRDQAPRMIQISAMGKTKSHLRMTFSSKGRSIKGVAFGMGELVESCRKEPRIEVLYTPSLNFFRGKRSWQVRVTDIKVVEM